jgi:DNA-binding NtrC family response regulator/ligand-binding sensor domain-containing protein
MPAVARLSFWIPSEKTVAFEAAYDERLRPLLTKLHLVETYGSERPLVNGICTHWFENNTVQDLARKRDLLLSDPDFQTVMLKWGQIFGTSRTDGKIEHSFQLHSRPAVLGHSALAGRGTSHWAAFDCTDGLVDSIVQTIVEDTTGHLWFGTAHGGVCQYDGETFRAYTTEDGLAGNEVWAALCDRQGSIWFGTNAGASRFNGERFESFAEADGLGSGRIESIAQDRDGTLWFATHSGVVRYDGKRFSPFQLETDRPVRVIFEDRAGSLWFGTDTGVIHLDGTSLTFLGTESGLAGSEIRSICADGDGNLWFGTHAGASRYDGSTFITLTESDGLAANGVVSMCLDKAGCLWFGTNSGATRYDGETCTTFTTQDGLVSNGLRTVYADSHGQLWLATNGGTSRYDHANFVTFTAQDGLTDNPIYSIIEDRRGTLWFGIRHGGLCRYDGSDGATFDQLEGSTSDLVRRLYEDRQGNLWISTQDAGACRFDGKTITTFTVEDGLASNVVESIREDSEGNIWFATSEGLSRYDGREFSTFTTEHGLAHRAIVAISEDSDGNLWIGSRHLGLARYDGERFRSFGAEDGLAGDGVTAILQDRDGQLWFGTNGGGVCRFDGNTFSTFTMSDGLAGNVVFSIAQATDGFLWFGTNGGGVSRYDGQTFTTYTTQDGLSGNVVWSIIEDRSGAMWLGTNKGASRIRLPEPVSPSVSVDAVVADRRHTAPDEVSIPYRVGSVAIEYHGLSLKTRPGAMRYRYRLTGHEDEWRTTDARRVEYLNLPIGNYCFDISAVDRDLAYSAPARVDLSVVADPRLEALTSALNQIGDEEFVGESQRLRQAQSQLAEVARTDVTVLILGETGTGKGLAANAVHMLSDRSGGPFVQVNCGAIPEGLFESEIFGHERGAFTGANARKLGRVELASGGTLFLDEIGDLGAQVQVKILRLLEEGTFERVGGTRTLKLDVRVIAATNRNIEQMVMDKTFREDLYFRLHAFPVTLPPLRDRREDISLLANYFMDRMAEHLRKGIDTITPEAITALERYHWPGNVRELQNVIQRAVIVCETSALAPPHLALGPGSVPGSLNGELITPEEYEKLFIQQLLEQSRGVIRGPEGAAALWGVPESTLRSRMKKLGISRK